jgi:hypothetical protein
MLSTLVLVLISSGARQGRAFTFLSYQDTVFAIRQRGVWTQPTKLTELPGNEVKLVQIGLSPSNIVRSGRMEPSWDSRAECFNVACEDFEHVMGWSVDPRYPRPLRDRPGAKKAALTEARGLLAARKVPFISLADPNVYSVDLDASGREELLVDVSGRTKTYGFGMAFLYSSRFPAHELVYDKEGWPRILAVADLDSDNVMEIIVGGDTAAGKCVSMWKFDHGHLKQLPHYATPQ